MGSKVNPDRQTLGEMDVHSDAEGVVPRLQVAADPSFSLSVCFGLNTVRYRKSSEFVPSLLQNATVILRAGRGCEHEKSLGGQRKHHVPVRYSCEACYILTTM